MKGYFKDSKEWDVVVIGDWRDKNGKTKGYSEKLADKLIFISGGIGMYFYHTGEFRLAVSSWEKDLIEVKMIERHQKTRFHKGWFYYMLGIAHQQMNNVVESRNYLRLAKQQDKIAYGKNAKTFPASKATLDKTQE